MKLQLLTLFCLVAITMRSTAGIISVSAKITDSGLTEQGLPVFAVEAEVKNLTNMPVSCAIMTCSWYDSWRIEPAEVLRLRGWGCDSNFPSELRLEPGKSVIFRFQVCARVPSPSLPPENKKLRVGFAIERWSGRSGHLPRRHYVLGIEWSGYVDLPNVREQELREIHEKK